MLFIYQQRTSTTRAEKTRHDEDDTTTPLRVNEKYKYMCVKNRRCSSLWNRSKKFTTLKRKKTALQRTAALGTMRREEAAHCWK